MDAPRELVCEVLVGMVGHRCLESRVSQGERLKNFRPVRISGVFKLEPVSVGGEHDC